ncbi:MAG: hypothetical protein H0X73_05720 [Chthoniobacterales bacterium]|nr:hypothetical protein [Chthoniobacterales bacterium]
MVNILAIFDWALTPTVFRPMFHELMPRHLVASVTDAESLRLARRWLLWDSFRVALIAIGFTASVRAISVPAATKEV